MYDYHLKYFYWNENEEIDGMNCYNGRIMQGERWICIMRNCIYVYIRV